MRFLERLILCAVLMASVLAPCEVFAQTGLSRLEQQKARRLEKEERQARLPLDQVCGETLMVYEAAKNKNLRDFLIRMQKELKPKSLPSSEPYLEPLLSFTVAPDGQITMARIEEPTAAPGFDRVYIDSVKNASPIKNVPSWIDKETEIYLDFGRDYNEAPPVAAAPALPTAPRAMDVKSRAKSLEMVLSFVVILAVVLYGISFIASRFNFAPNFKIRSLDASPKIPVNEAGLPDWAKWIRLNLKAFFPAATIGLAFVVDGIINIYMWPYCLWDNKYSGALDGIVCIGGLFSVQERYVYIVIGVFLIVGASMTFGIMRYVRYCMDIVSMHSGKAASVWIANDLFYAMQGEIQNVHDGTELKKRKFKLFGFGLTPEELPIRKDANIYFEPGTNTVVAIKVGAAILCVQGSKTQNKAMFMPWLLKEVHAEERTSGAAGGAMKEEVNRLSRPVPQRRQTSETVNPGKANSSVPSTFSADPAVPANAGSSNSPKETSYAPPSGAANSPDNVKVASEDKMVHRHRMSAVVTPAGVRPKSNLLLLAMREYLNPKDGPLEILSDESQGQFNSTSILVNVAGIAVMIMFVPEPYPLDDPALNWAIRNDFLWKGAAEAFARSGGHVTVAVMSSPISHEGKLSSARVLTIATAGVIDSMSGSGVFWIPGECVIDPERFRSDAAELRKEEGAATAWFSFVILPGAGDPNVKLNVCQSTGLTPFLGREIECGPYPNKAGELAFIVQIASRYMATRGPIFQDGSILNFPGDGPKGLRLTLEKSQRLGFEQPVYCLALASQDVQAPAAETGRPDSSSDRTPSAEDKLVDRRSMSVVVTPKGVRLSRDMFALAIKEFLNPEDGSPEFFGESNPDTFIANICGTTIAVMFIPSPYPSDDEVLRWALGNELLWKDAEDAFAKSSGHVILAVLNKPSTHEGKISTLRALSFATSAVIDSMSGLGVLWVPSESVINPEHFRMDAARLCKEKGASSIWFSFIFLPGSADRSDKSLVCQSRGLNLFLEREIECGPYLMPPQELSFRVITVAHQMASDGPVYKDGYTFDFGDSGLRYARLSLETSRRLGDERPVFRLALSQAKPD